VKPQAGEELCNGFFQGVLRVLNSAAKQ
jgi:hypothetical protein